MFGQMGMANVIVRLKMTFIRIDLMTAPRSRSRGGIECFFFCQIGFFGLATSFLFLGSLTCLLSALETLAGNGNHLFSNSERLPVISHLSLKAKNKIPLLDGSQANFGRFSDEAFVLPGVALGEEIAAGFEMVGQLSQEAAVKVEAVGPAK